jgi:hypothetical protein
MIILKVVTCEVSEIIFYFFKGEKLILFRIFGKRCVIIGKLLIDKI